jgi:hypothetical protein
MQVSVPWSGSATGGPTDGLEPFCRGSERIIETFIGVVSDNYWSSTTYADNTTNAWNVNLNNGNVNANNKTNTNYVWPVRGGE